MNVSYPYLNICTYTKKPNLVTQANNCKNDKMEKNLRLINPFVQKSALQTTFFPEKHSFLILFS